MKDADSEEQVGLGAAKALVGWLHSRDGVPFGVGNPELVERTPLRMARALKELTEGMHTDAPKLTTFEVEDADQVVGVRAIPFVSLCEHHVLPFTGTVGIVYLPGKRIIGLSKLPRLVRHVSRRLQVQERITKELADELERALEPAGVVVVVRGRHTCMMLRGVESDGEMVTSVVRGVFRTKPEARAEALRLLETGGDR